MTTSTTVKPFHNQNGYTALNNYILDYIMPKLSPNAWKVLCFIIRKTEGWNKEQDKLSFSQIMTGTGIKNRSTVSSAIDELVNKKNYVNLVKGDRITSNTYSLNTELEIIIGSPENGLPTDENIIDQQEPSPEIGPSASPEIGLPLVQKMDTQNQSLNQQERNLSKDKAAEPLKRKKPKEISSELIPNTPEARILFAKINRNRQMNGRRQIKKFSTFEQKEACTSEYTRLGDETFKACLDYWLTRGVTALGDLTIKLTQWNKNGANNGQRQKGTPEIGTSQETIDAWEAVSYGGT